MDMLTIVTRVFTRKALAASIMAIMVSNYVIAEDRPKEAPSWVLRTWHCQMRGADGQVFQRTRLTVAPAGRKLKWSAKMGPFPGESGEATILAVKGSTATLKKEDAYGGTSGVRTAYIADVTTDSPREELKRFRLMKLGQIVVRGEQDDAPETLAHRASFDVCQ